MDKICVVFLALFAILFPLGVAAQTKQSALDRYLETGKTVVVAKCLWVGSMNILGKTHVAVDILHVVKGKETFRKIWVVSHHSMEEGERYLLRTEADATTERNYFTINTIDSVVPISPNEKIETMKELSPRIIVLRTMNMRVYMLEYEIQQRTSELEALKNTRMEN